MFRFQQFAIDDSHCGMKVGTDGVLVGSWAPIDGVRTVVDAGSGSALIALMVAQRLSERGGDFAVTAVEIDRGAHADGVANIAASPWATKVTAVYGDIAGADIAEGSVDLLVSNPPFFNSGEHAPAAERAAARHAASLSPQSLVGLASRLLTGVGALVMITPAEDADSVTWSAEIARLKVRRLWRVASVEGRRPLRLLWQICRRDGPLLTGDMAIRRADGSYTDDFRMLTEKFYLK